MKEIIFEYENIKRIKYTSFPDYDKWYTRENYINLNKLKNSIDKIEENAYRDFFLLCFLSIAKRFQIRGKHGILDILQTMFCLIWKVN